ncbi:AAA family ATPase [Hymenobacter sp. BT770]|nr:AAA family ATPase [Hymenobacter sp. BT770]MDO3416549.1 AAA family ATPase [Hymenobacter sp. BT770]
MAPASLDFGPGLNIITGPTDTGKSWVFECIAFLLGSSNKPREIAQSKGYTEAYLELLAFPTMQYTLKRKFEDTDTLLFRGAYQAISELKSTLLKQKEPSKKHPHTISSFLLQLCGFGEATHLPKNEEGITEKFSFHTLRPLLLADEVGIIEKNSPLTVKGFANSTKAASLFNLLLTGIGAAEPVKKLKKEVVSAGRNGELKMISTLIKRLEDELAALLELESADVENEIGQTNIRLNRALSMLNTLDSERRTLLNRASDIETKALTLSEIRIRFDTLKEHYYSDVQRLEFISEGLFLFDDLHYIACPFCATPLGSDHRRAVCERDSLSNELVQQACQQEAANIRRQLSELELALGNISTQQEELSTESNTISAQYQEIDNRIAQGIVPEIESLRYQLSSFAEKRTQAFERELLVRRLEQFRDLEDSLSITSGEKATKLDRSLAPMAIASFCQQVEYLLTEWKIEFSPPITFDQSPKVLDIVLGGEPRTNSGKGTRAITYSAFLLGLLMHCKVSQIPHSNCIVLDSPLTTRQNPEQTTDDKLLPQEVQASVLRIIAEVFSNEQVIVIENKIPHFESKAPVHYNIFTKNPNNGRYGFFPYLQ